jgi:hypothetical protein
VHYAYRTYLVLAAIFADEYNNPLGYKTKLHKLVLLDASVVDVFSSASPRLKRIADRSLMGVNQYTLNLVNFRHPLPNSTLSILMSLAPALLAHESTLDPTTLYKHS